MKKALAGVLVAVLLVGAAPVSAQSGRGGLMGFVAGCCFGVRAAADYNDGKEIHWREWCRMIPYAGIVFAIWDGVEGAKGMTRADYVANYGATFY